MQFRILRMSTITLLCVCVCVCVCLSPENSSIPSSVVFFTSPIVKMIEILSAIVLGLFFILFYIRKKPKNYPPGLPSHPFVGSIPFMDRDLRKTFTNLHKKFGPGQLISENFLYDYSQTGANLRSARVAILHRFDCTSKIKSKFVRI